MKTGTGTKHRKECGDTLAKPSVIEIGRVIAVLSTTKLSNFSEMSEFLEGQQRLGSGFETAAVG